MQLQIRDWAETKTHKSAIDAETGNVVVLHVVCGPWALLVHWAERNKQKWSKNMRWILSSGNVNFRPLEGSFFVLFHSPLYRRELQAVDFGRHKILQPFPSAGDRRVEIRGEARALACGCRPLIKPMRPTSSWQRFFLVKSLNVASFTILCAFVFFPNIFPASLNSIFPHQPIVQSHCLSLSLSLSLVAVLVLTLISRLDLQL